MGEFKPINTQEEFDAAIQQRLERERAKFGDYETLKEKAGKYDAIAGKDYEKTIAKLQQDLEAANGRVTDVQGKLDAANGKVAELTGRAEKAETSLLKSKIAHEHNIPHELAERLSGGTEEELRKDAESFAKLMGGGTPPAPLAALDEKNNSTADAALAQLDAQLFKT